MWGDFHILKVASRAGAALFTVEAITAEGQSMPHKEIFEIVVNVPPGASEEEIAVATRLEVHNYLRQHTPLSEPLSSLED